MGGSPKVGNNHLGHPAAEFRHPEPVPQHRPYRSLRDLRAMLPFEQPTKRVIFQLSNTSGKSNLECANDGSEA